MDTTTLVVEQIDGGRKLIDWLVEHSFPITAAFWSKDDSDCWRLYIGTPAVEQQGPLYAHSELHRAVSALRTVWADSGEAIEPWTVKLLPSTEQTVQNTAALLRRYPGSFDTWIGARYTGNAATEGTFIYAPSHTAPAAP